MVQIRCGACAGVHDSVAEVRRCHERTPAGARPAASREPAPGDGGKPPAAVTGRAPWAPSPHAGVPVAGPLLDDSRLAGPDALGRHVLVRPGQEPPPAWAGAERLRIDAAALADAGPALTRLRAAGQARVRLVIEVAPEADHPPSTSEGRAPSELGPRFEPVADALHALAVANAVDLRDPAAPRFWPVDRATHLGAHPGGRADVVLPDGSPAWCDGGPIQAIDPALLGGAALVHRVGLEHGSLQPMGPTVSAAALAPDQLAAVTHPGGAARIIAPAGSGKTRVLTERARLLLTAWGLPPGAVTLVAFNKRAQEEMRDRTPDLPGLQVRTLNALALAIVNGDRPFAPQGRRWRTVDELDVRRHLDAVVKVARRRNQDPYATWIEALGRARLGLQDPEDVEAAYRGDVEGFAEVLPRYRAGLHRRGELDFDEQILAAIELLLAEPAARLAAQRACRLLLVDEFQDLTPAHLLLVRLLASPDLAVFGVGDDDQTIYGYNGADPVWLVGFGDLFPGAGDHPLHVNYRCPAGVVLAASNLLQRNRVRVPKEIVAAPGRTDVGLEVAPGPDAVAATTERVRAEIGGGRAPADLAVLTRVNVSVLPVAVALHAAGVPVRADVGESFLGRTAVRAVTGWMSMALDPEHLSPDAVAEALKRPSRRLHPRVVDWAAERHDVAGLRRLAGSLQNARDAESLQEALADLARLQRLAGTGASTEDLVAFVLEDIGVAGAVATLDSARAGTNRAAQVDDAEALLALARLHPDAATFLPWLARSVRVPSDPAGVTLATVHRVKGQEWPVVLVHLAAAGQFPHRLAEDAEEERRLFHVAITRARHHAVVVPGPAPSPFLRELAAPPGPGERPVAAPAASGAGPAGPRRLVRSATVATEEPTSPEGRRAVALLRALRQELRDGKPAYTVFSDRTLFAIATALPTDLAELARVPGIGPAKLEQYGDAVLAAVADALGA